MWKRRRRRRRRTEQVSARLRMMSERHWLSIDAKTMATTRQTALPQQLFFHLLSRRDITTGFFVATKSMNTPPLTTKSADRERERERERGRGRGKRNENESNSSRGKTQPDPIKSNNSDGANTQIAGIFDKSCRHLLKS